MRDPKKSTIGELLTGETEYVIPRYQRNFDWKSQSQVNDLLVDLIATTDATTNDNLYLGTMIFDVSEEKTRTRLEVIDGQQRLTTILILLMALRDYARWTLNDESVAQSLQKLISNSDALSTKGGHRLKPSPVVDRIFSMMSDYQWDGKFPTHIKVDGQKVWIRTEVNRVRPIYNFCLKEISDYSKGDSARFKSLALHARDKTYIIKISIEERSEAFEVFERTNARGKGLEVSDLLKNYIFSQETNIIGGNLDQEWDDIIDSFRLSSLKALKQFWIARAGKVNSRELYRHIKTYADKLGVNDFLAELKDFARFYNAYHSDDGEHIKAWLKSIGFPKENMLMQEFRRSIGVLKLFNITQPIPLIYATMRSFNKIDGNKDDAKRVISLLRRLEYFHFINNKVGGQIGNESENAYARFSEKIFSSEDLSQLDKVQTWFDKALLPEDIFKASFLALSYNNQSERNVIRYVFDRIINDGAKDGQALDLLDLVSAQAGIRTSYDIEHLMPKSLAKDPAEQVLYHSIGNLLVISKQINGILSDKTFEEKIAILKNPHNFNNDIKHIPSYLQEFVAINGEKDWDADAINERAEDLATQSYKIASQKSRYK